MTKTTRTDLKKFSTGVKPPAKPTEAKIVKIDEEKLENKLLNYLSQRASYVSELGREFSEEFGKEASKLKVDCHKVLRSLVSSGGIRRRKMSDAYGNVRVYYFHRNTAESLFHRAMISMTKGLISREGFKLISPRAGCDTAFEFNNKKIGVECETELKHNLKKFAKDLRQRCKEYYQVWVICRNTSDQKRYHDQTKSEVGAHNIRYKNLKTCKEALRRIKK